MITIATLTPDTCGVVSATVSSAEVGNSDFITFQKARVQYFNEIITLVGFGTVSKPAIVLSGDPVNFTYVTDSEFSQLWKLAVGDILIGTVTGAVNYPQPVPQTFQFWS